MLVAKDMSNVYSVVYCKSPTSKVIKFYYSKQNPRPLIHCWGEYNKGTAILENRLAVSLKTKHIVASNCFPKKKASVHPTICTWLFVSFLYNGQKLLTAKMSYTRWMVKQSVEQSYHRNLLSNKNEWTTGTCHTSVNLKGIKLSGKANFKLSHTVCLYSYDILAMTKL